MKILEILPEAIESKRSDIRKVLNDNKEKLQKSRTRIGVIKNLRRMFPDVVFKMFGDRSASGSYLPHSKVIQVYNNRKLFSGKYVRDNWDSFVDRLEDTLTHEVIHKDQYARDVREQPSVFSQVRGAVKSAKEHSGKNYQQRWMDLNELLDDYKSIGANEKYREVRKQIDNLVRKAKRDGVLLKKSRRNYLDDRLEITAYAEQAAEDILKEYRRFFENRDRKISNEQLRRLAIDLLRSEPTIKTFSSAIDAYLGSFEKNEKVTKQFLKQVVRYIEQKTQ